VPTHIEAGRSGYSIRRTWPDQMSWFHMRESMIGETLTTASLARLNDRMRIPLLFDYEGCSPTWSHLYDPEPHSSDSGNAGVDIKLSSLYDRSSLQELRKYVADRQMPCKHLRTKDCTKKATERKAWPRRRKSRSASCWLHFTSQMPPLRSASSICRLS
jgi:hypothetical protein